MTAVAKKRVRAVSYPETDHMGEGLLQRLIMELLRPMIARFLAEHGKVAAVGADQFIYFREGDPSRRIAPDVYVLPGVRPGKRIRSWKVWQEGIAPNFCFEVVSDDVRYDYEEKPILYGEMGTQELVVFDPDSEGHAGRFRWQVFRRVKGRGLIRVDVSQADRIQSKELGVWLRHVGEGDELRVVPAFGKNGDELMLTPDQRADHERAEKEKERAEKEKERAEKEKERAEKEKERAEKEKERAEKEVAEREIKRLNAELATLRRLTTRQTKPRRT
jgi:hypothetical protein